MKILAEGGRRLYHFPREDGTPYCGTEAKLAPREHPIDAAGVWCTACMQTAAGIDRPGASLGSRAVTYDSRPDTYEHIGRVRLYLTRAMSLLLDRALVHDKSKLEPPELEVFDEFTPKLAELEYGSDAYEAARVAMGAGLEHHYAHNSHHPEHYVAGIAGMTLLDLLEMLCDWKAASERHRKRPQMPAAPGRPAAPQYDSNIERSIALNQERFGYGDELAAILTNTARELGLV